MIKNNLKAALKKKHLKNSALSEHLGVHYRTVGKWMQNREQPHPKRRVLIAKFLGLSVDELFYNVENKEQ